MRSWRNVRKRSFCPPVFAPLFDMAGCFSPGCRAQGGRWRKGRGKTACADQRRAALRFAPRVCSEPGCEGRKGRRGERGGIRLQGDNRKWALRLARHLQCPRVPESARGRAFGARRQIADRRSGGGSPAGAASETGANTKGVKKAFAPLPLGHNAMDSGAKNSRFRWACARPARTVLFGAGLRTGARSLPTRRPGPGAGPAGRARGPRCGPPFRRCWQGAGRGRGWAGR